MSLIFIDTDILIDLIADRQPFSKFAIELFEKAEQKEVQLFVSSHTYATTHYLLKKYLAEKQLREVLLSLLNLVNIVAIDADVIRKSLLSTHKDFEDAIQIIAAHSVPRLDFIVTRNLKDFKDAGISVLPPDEVLKYL